MKNLLTFLITLSIFLISSCAVSQKTFSQQEKINRLEIELSKFNSFRITGQCDLQYQAFVIRRPCVIIKSKDKIRFDILDAGIFGLGGGTFMALYADEEKIQYKTPGSNSISEKMLDDKLKAWFDFLSESIIDELKERKIEIINTYSTELRGIRFNFNNDMSFKSIVNQENEISVFFDYDRSNNLNQLRVNSPLIRNLTISIDKIDYSENIVMPLKN